MVVPCFNEGARWDMSYWLDMIEIPNVSWVFVDDGSTDNTRGLLLEVQGATARAMCLPRNQGKAQAIRLGLLSALSQGTANGSGVGFIDADGAFTRGDVTRLVGKFDEVVSTDNRFDALWSARVAMAGRNIQRSAVRHYLGRLVATYLALGSDLVPYDTQSGLKLFEASSDLAECLAIPFRTRWLFEVELISRWKMLTGRTLGIWEEPLDDWRDVHGSKVTPRESLRIAGELIEVKRLQRRSARSLNSHPAGIDTDGP
jgi:glycosyltransferase involved in cell wall biosynthesis